MNTELDIIKRRLVGHGALLIFLGGVLGFGFLFFLMERIALWPFPFSIDMQLPGTYDAWRMAHMEGIVNGFGLWIAAAVLPIFPFGIKGLNRIAWGLISVGWTIVIASAMDPLFPDSRGLEFGSPATNQVAFFLFYWGVVLVMIIMGVIAWRCLAPTKR